MAINTFLSQQLAKSDPQRPITMILELPEGEEITPSSLTAFTQVPGTRIKSQAFNFVTVVAPVSSIPALERESVKVHYNAPRGIISAPFLEDPVFGRFTLSDVTLPFNRQEMVIRNVRGAPRSLLQGPAAFLSQFGVRTPQFVEPSAIIIPTGETRQLLHPPEDSLLRETKVAVLDTGLSLPHPQFNLLNGVRPTTRSTTGEPPFDLLGHGQWCTCAAFGSAANTKYGLCQGVATATGSLLLHVKCLSNLGFGSTESVLLAMEQSVAWGAKVVSMSLGGPIQGSVDEDPECQILKRLRDEVIFVVAAGNSGPTSWTIGSPGASPYAVCVGAYSTHYQGTAIFSSRGPSTDYYRDNPGIWKSDLSKYGIDMQKPDCLAPGGGPVREGDRVDQIYSGVVGWTNGMTDLNPFDVWDAMRGTSMATPAAAGLIALAYEGGAIRTGLDVREKLKNTANGSKSISDGYGFLTFERLIDA